jgi:hypothetical protein
MQIIKNKNIKWWIGFSSFSLLFLVIFVFAYSKMHFLMSGVQIKASIQYKDGSSVVEVNGQAEKAIHLSLNGREIFVDKNGSFTELISLLPGYDIITLDAKDKFGNTAIKKFEVYYKI